MTDIIVETSSDSPEARAVFEGLAAEYDIRYRVPGGPPRTVESEIAAYPPPLFTPPLGVFLVLRRGDRTIAGGAFMSHDDETVEFKRIWTHPDLRRQGLAARILAALEARAVGLGYVRAYLTTGFRQPEAMALYRRYGFRPLFDPSADPALYRSLPFEKPLAEGLAPGPFRHPAATPDQADAVVTAIKAAQAERILARLARHQQQRETA